MAEPESTSHPILTRPGVGAPGRTYTPLIEAETNNPHGLRDLLIGLGMLALVLGILAILGRVAEPLNFVLAGLVVFVVGAIWLLLRRANH